MHQLLCYFLSFCYPHKPNRIQVYQIPLFDKGRSPGLIIAPATTFSRGLSRCGRGNDRRRR